MAATLGTHWLLDAFDCRGDRLGDPDFVRGLLIDLPTDGGTPVGASVYAGH